MSCGPSTALINPVNKAIEDVQHVSGKVMPLSVKFEANKVDYVMGMGIESIPFRFGQNTKKT